MTEQTLINLAVRCEQATGPDRELDARLHVVREDGFGHRDQAPDYTASVDAAATLVPADHDWLVRSDGAFANVSRKDAVSTVTLYEPFNEPTRQERLDAEAFRQGHRYGNAATPALALCAAALRARAAQ